MSNAVYQYEWRTDPSSQLRGTLAQNVGVDLDISLSGFATPQNPTALAGINGDARGELQSLTIASIQNLSWEIWLWRSATHKTLSGGVTSAGNNFIGKWLFAVADGVQVGGAGDFVYFAEGLSVPLHDDDFSAKYHLTLINRSATGKLAGDAGAIQIMGRVSLPVY